MFGLFSATKQTLSQTKEIFLESLNFIDAMIIYSGDKTKINLLRVEDTNHRLMTLLEGPEHSREGLGYTCIRSLYNLLPSQLSVEHLAWRLKDFTFGIAGTTFGAAFVGMLTLNPFTPLILAAAVVITGSSYLGERAAEFLAVTIGEIARYLKEHDPAQTNDFNLTSSNTLSPG